MRKIKVGYQIDFRYPPGSKIPFPEFYAEMLSQAEAVEAAGFDSIWLTEHHFTDDGYLPAMMPVAAAIAARPGASLSAPSSCWCRFSIR